MKTKNKKISKKVKILRIAAGIFGLGIIIFFLTVTMSFTGNPISKLLAHRAAEKYVEREYSEHNLDVENVFYNFKIGGYDVTVQDKNSKDVRFSVIYKSGEGVVSDDYKYMVTERGSTLARLEEEASESIKPCVQSFADKNSLELSGRCLVYFTNIMENTDKIPPLNTPFSKELGLKGEVFTDFKSDSDMDVNQIADTLKGVYTTLIDEGYSVDKVVMEVQMPNGAISVSAEEKLIDDNLAENIEKLMKDENAIIDGMYVFYKNEVVAQDTQSK